MKKQFLIKILFFIVLLYVSCSTSTITDNSQVNEIVKSAIDLSNTYIQKKDFKQAIRVYDDALKTLRDYRLLYNKAQILVYMGKYSEAIELCTDAVKEFPYIISFKSALADFIEKKADKIKFDSEETVLLDEKLKTCVLTKTDRKTLLKQAINVLENILQENPYDKKTRIHLIKLLSDIGDKEAVYNNYLILWNQGNKDKDIVEELYKYKNEVWYAVYNVIMSKKTVTNNSEEQPDKTGTSGKTEDITKTNLTSDTSANTETSEKNTTGITIKSDITNTPKADTAETTETDSTDTTKTTQNK